MKAVPEWFYFVCLYNYVQMCPIICYISRDLFETIMGFLAKLCFIFTYEIFMRRDFAM